jgi:hypothetical protein
MPNPRHHRGSGHTTRRSDGQVVVKVSYPTASDAVASARSLRAKGFDLERLVPYRCRAYPHWHLGWASPAHYRRTLWGLRLHGAKLLAALIEARSVDG